MSTASNQLPTRGTWGGYIYVIAFSNAEATLKVGSTANPQSRLATHRGSGEPFGISVTQWWFSSEHTNYLSNEKDLIRAAEQMGGRKTRLEFFSGVAFADVVATASRMTFRGRPSAAELAAEEARRRNESRRQMATHDAAERAILASAVKHAAKEYNLDADQAARLFEPNPAGLEEAARARDGYIEVIRHSRRNANRGRRVPA
jgi:hypothetical protein